jgi:hypothetical protein
MGTATIELRREAIDRLKRYPYTTALQIVREDPLEGDLFLVLIFSKFLPKTQHYGTLELVIEDNYIRFKRWADL